MKAMEQIAITVSSLRVIIVRLETSHHGAPVMTYYYNVTRV